ncbi:hypothetical protein PAAG_07012 [Paracoccidioides lutzii Pb01]|uniref:Uncharacterized protein n=1 Tax=Paracoccidioides lutzii (strain ATCC MYA-826 / Pb01) TaxID=502779 RepID=C1H835_PARBA|nr:hypothetical protein PAAG_07012 [Paracoccidioides lutzii Pb01]EEH36594.1 hypothetical protein PAAG_07012 [Paracoccidioides lutzii Pb01]
MSGEQRLLHLDTKKLVIIIRLAVKWPPEAVLVTPIPRVLISSIDGAGDASNWLMAGRLADFDNDVGVSNYYIGSPTNAFLTARTRAEDVL